MTVHAIDRTSAASTTPQWRARSAAGRALLHAAAILLAVSLLIVTGTRGEVRDPAVRIISPATK